MIITTVHNPLLGLLCLAVGIGMAWWLYNKAAGKEAFSKGLSMLLAVFRALAVAIIAFFLLEPMLRILVREVRKPVVVVLHDGSSSLLAVGDSSALRNSFAPDLEDLVARLADRYDVQTFTYGEQVREGLHFDQSDALTDIGQGLRAVYDRFSGPDLGAVLITGDGIYNRGRDPRLEAQRLGVPVHSIALGDTTVRPDLVLKAVEHNRINFLGNEFPLLVRVEARHLKGVRTRVTVSHMGRELAGRDILVGSDPFVLELPFSLKAERPGLQRYTVSLRTVEGESSAVNNARDIHIEVLDDRQQVLLLGAAPHPDLGALKLALDGLEGYGTELAYASEFAGQPEAYDLIILHHLPTVQMGIKPLLERAALRAVPLLFILGPGMDFNSYNEQGAAVRVTNVRPSTTDAMPGVDREFSAFTMEQDQVRALERFPPLQVPFGQYEVGRAASSMLVQRVGAVRTPYPLLALVQQEERRMATITGEGLWRWRLGDMQQNGSHQHFDRLVHKLVQYLAIKQDKSRFRVEHAPEFAANDAVLLTAELYNASYERVNTPEVALLLKDEEGREFPYAFSRSADAYRLDAGRLPPGTYTWQATTALDGDRFSVAGELVVRGSVMELVSTVADHGLLADLAVRSGGIMVVPDGLDAVEEAIRKRREIVARSYVHAVSSDLIGVRWIFFALLALLTAEWVLRRRNGAY